MAYIGHRCGCGHLDIHHKTDAARSSCQADGGHSCGRGCRKSTKALLLPTFDLKGRPVERIVPPGERWGAPNGGPMTTCACDNCQVLYAERTAA
jgi:hypothetical protein